MAFIIAVDGGGTKTQAILYDENGQQLGEGWSGPTSLTATTVGAASFNLREAVRQAVDGKAVEGQPFQVAALVMGLAGMDTPAESEQAHKTFADVLQGYAIQHFQIVNDIVIALESGTDKPDAVALISGTGSNCYGRNSEGQTAQSGGLDYLLSDQGSGYAIGRATLRMAVKSFDGRAEKTSLEQKICQHFRIASIAELKDHVYNPLLTKTEIAEISKICAQAKEEGDRVAQVIFDHAASDLAEMAGTVIRRLNIPGRPVDCVLAGGIAKLPYIHQKLEEQLKQVCPNINVISPEQHPVTGALKLARRVL